MVEALFSEPNYLASKKALDAIALRQEAIASNLANLETPDYKRLDLAPTFQTELEHACAAGDAQRISALNPTLTPDTAAEPVGRDGNTVSLEQEMALLNQNAMVHALETQLVSGSLAKLRMAITAKSS